MNDIEDKNIPDVSIDDLPTKLIHPVSLDFVNKNAGSKATLSISICITLNFLQFHLTFI